MWRCLTLAHSPQLYLKFATHNMALFAVFPSLNRVLKWSLHETLCALFESKLLKRGGATVHKVYITIENFMQF